MRRRSMGALGIPSNSSYTIGSSNHGAVVEEIPGLIKVYKDGHVDRPPVIADVPSTWSPEPDVASKDVGFAGGVWGRLYVPKLGQHQKLLPLLVYFHGGGFCVGSAAWRCYHEFLARLASAAKCSILSANYRLAPEHRLPAAYEDGAAVMRWVGQQASNTGRATSDELSWWRNQCDFTRVFLSGDSAGAAIAYQTAVQVGNWPESMKLVHLRGVILIQPFFGGQERTSSERNLVQSPRSALRLETSDCYWRLALPPGSSRDHPWCNPMGKGAAKMESLRLPAVLVCSGEMDILKDRNIEFCRGLKRAGKAVEQKIYAGVGHAFQVLHNYHMSESRTQEMIEHIKAFVKNR